MPHHFANIAFTPTVKRMQEQLGSRSSYLRMETVPGIVNHRLSDAEGTFIAARDSFYMATVSETGWPYVQHRGGPPGFVRVLDDSKLGFADFRGNRQYVSVGNLTTDDRVSLFFMDYARKTRLKLFGRAKFVDPDNHAAMAQLELTDYRARVERGIVVHVEGFDWNCPQHITERFTAGEVQTLTAALTTRITELERELAHRPALPATE